MVPSGFTVVTCMWRGHHNRKLVAVDGQIMSGGGDLIFAKDGVMPERVGNLARVAMHQPHADLRRRVRIFAQSPHRIVDDRLVVDGHRVRRRG